jgi:PhzF family phenazine biosynthesis protein
MNLPIYIVDAFADRPLSGNPAAVCPLDAWLPDATMQAIAAEMNLSETVFFAPDGADAAADPAAPAFGIRWFTPIREVELIGHATLAAGFLVLTRLEPGAAAVRFRNGGDEFLVSRDGAALALEMPALPPKPVEPPPALAAALGRPPREVLAARHYLCVFANPSEIAALRPDMAALSALPLPAVIATAPADREAGRDAVPLAAGAPAAVDFVSRFFAPANGVPEDPVSGVAHLCLAPYWARRLGRKKLVGRQLSARGGIVACEDCGTRVRLGGSAAIFLEGRIAV